MQKKILFITPYPFDSAPSQRLKFEQYYSAFELNGYNVSKASFISNMMWEIVYKKGYFMLKTWLTIIALFNRYKLLFSVHKYDIIYLHLWGTPFGFAFYEWLLRKLSKKLIYDIDDLIYMGNVNKNNRIISWLKTSIKPKYLLRTADQILVSTDKLYEFAKSYNNQVSLIPATIDVSKYSRKEQNLSNNIVIGWSGSSTTSKYLHLIDIPLKKISENRKVRIQVMGDPLFHIDGLENLEIIKWTSEQEISNIQRFDIGLHPLPDEAWVYGKSGGKLVQYMAAGIPIITSAIGPNFKAIINGYNGFLVQSDEEWIEKMELLVNDPLLRAKMGENARIHAEKFYSIETNLPLYLDVFKA